VTTVIDRVGRSDTERPARLPDQTGLVERDGVRVGWEAYGADGPAILPLPTWSIIHSRHWKAQIRCLARHLRVVTFDGWGNGLSDRPSEVPRSPRSRARWQPRPRESAEALAKSLVPVLR
jgi:pimeloyl-ACP methyl ester carboxylesterase